MKSRPRILCVMQLPPPVHGASVVNDHVARSNYLAARFAIDVLPLKFADSVADVGHASLKKVVRGCRTAVDLALALARERPDAVYLTISPVGMSFYRDCVLVGITRVFGVDRILHLHAKGVSSRASSPWLRAIYRNAFRGARVIQSSSLLAQDLEHVVHTEQLAVVPYGVPDEGGRRDVPSSPGSPVRILYLSNMIETKGPGTLLEALELLAARGVPFEATFAGGATDESFLAAFVSRIESLGLSKKVRYVGPAYGGKKAELFKQHDVFVLPTYYPLECFPLVLLEAMQWGLPVVSTREGGIPDIVDHEETGLLVPRVDSLAVANALETLAMDPKRRLAMGRSARVRYLERFTLHRFEEQLAKAWSVALA